MPKCKKSEVQAVDYASNILSPADEETFEEHLKNCQECTEVVQSYVTLLECVDAAQLEVRVPDLTLQDIEMNVYKRLAATQDQTLLSRLRKFFANFGFLFRWQRTAAASSIAIALITIAFLTTHLFQPQPSLQLTEMQSADARIEQYRQQHIQRDLEEALIANHLRNDTWETESRLYSMKEHAQGTDWTKVADEHFQNLHSGTRNSKGIN